jgi:hypothetical protein
MPPLLEKMKKEVLVYGKIRAEIDYVKNFFILYW